MSDRSFWMFWLGALFMGLVLTPALMEVSKPHHRASITCDLYKLPTNVPGGLPADEVIKRCGAPATAIQYPDVTEWVYAVDTFVWLRDGKLSAVKAPR